MATTRREAPVKLGLALEAGALACVGIAYVKRDSVGVQGAYFNRAVGRDEVAVAWSSDVRPWLLAAGALVLARSAVTAHGR